jgi:hypothetical protein
VPEKFVVVAVGDRSKIGAELEKELSATADVRDPDGQPVK